MPIATGVPPREKGDHDNAIADWTPRQSGLIPTSPKLLQTGEQNGPKKASTAAVSDFSEAIRLGLQHDAKAYLGRGLAYSRQGDFDRAIADYTQAIQLDLSNADAYFKRAWACGKRGDHDKAITDCTEAIRLDPHNAQAYCWRGAGLVDKGRYDQAIADLTHAIRLDPSLAWSFVFRGLLKLARARSGQSR